MAVAILVAISPPAPGKVLVFSESEEWFPLSSSSLSVLFSGVSFSFFVGSFRNSRRGNSRRRGRQLRPLLRRGRQTISPTFSGQLLLPYSDISSHYANR